MAEGVNFLFTVEKHTGYMKEAGATMMSLPPKVIHIHGVGHNDPLLIPSARACLSGSSHLKVMAKKHATH